MTKVIKVPENEVAPETGVPFNRSILHADEVVKVPEEADTSTQEALEKARYEVESDLVALTKEAGITGDTHVELGGVVVPLVPEDMITTESKVHATPAPTVRKEKGE